MGNQSLFCKIVKENLFSCILGSLALPCGSWALIAQHRPGCEPLLECDKERNNRFVLHAKAGLGGILWPS
jgi:hypothetical protein